MTKSAVDELLLMEKRRDADEALREERAEAALAWLERDPLADSPEAAETKEQAARADAVLRWLER